MSKYGVISGLYFPVFSPNTGKDGIEITPYLDDFPAVPIFLKKGSSRCFFLFFCCCFFQNKLRKNEF